MTKWMYNIYFNCMSYAKLDSKNGGSWCLIWFDEHRDITDFDDNDTSYIRMAATSSHILDICLSLLKSHNLLIKTHICLSLLINENNAANQNYYCSLFLHNREIILLLNHESKPLLKTYLIESLMDWFDWCDFLLRSDNYHEDNGLLIFFCSVTVCFLLIQFIWLEFAKELRRMLIRYMYFL